MKLTFYGHATFSIEVNGKTLLFDPFFNGNPAVKNADPEKVKADYIFLTHGHGDHTGDVVAIAKRTGAVCVAPAEIAGWLGKQGVEKGPSDQSWGSDHAGFRKGQGGECDPFLLLQ